MRIILSLLFFIIGLFNSYAAYAGVVSSMPPPPVRIFIADSSLKPIEFRRLEINAEVIGNISNTVFDMTLLNPNSRVLEGELQFPLMSNQTVTAFSLEMEDGKMRDAVPVEKSRGREVFEEIVRRGVDPALLEMTSGNNFKLRVYPLSPNKTRRVRVVISELLPEENGSLIYRMPLEYGQRIEALDISLKIAHKGKPLIKSSPFDDFNFEGKDGNWVCAINKSSQTINGTLVLEIPLLKKDENKKLYTGNKDGVSYFYAEIPIIENVKMSNPKKVDILWDASASGKTRNLTRELSFLEAFFSKVSNVSVSLVIVRNSVEPVLNYEIKDGNWKELKSVLEKIIYDGATNLGALMDIPDGADMKLLFSDGLDNFSIVKFSSKTPLFALVSAPGSDINSLRHLAEKSGGALLDLTVYDPQTALEYMNYSVENISFDGHVSNVVWNISGKDLKLSGVIKDKSKPFSVVVNNVKNVLTHESGSEYSFVPTIWATKKVSDLEAEYDINKAEIRRIGLSFRLVTRGTSLIVLERAEDYVMYDIEPPAELKKEYDRLRIQARPAQNNEKNKIERVVREWESRKAWWNKDFEKGSIPKDKKTLEQISDIVGQLIPSGSGSPRPSPAMMDQMSAPAANSPQMLAAAPAQDSSVNETESERKEEQGPAGTVISIRQWTSDTAYVTRMKEANAEQVYRIYLDERPDYESSPAFYLDAASQLEAKGQKELALRVLSNLAEMNLENRQILRVLGYRLMQIGHPEFAVVIFKKVLEIGGEEPQSYRDLGLAYEAIGEYQRAVDLLYSVAEKSFSRNFPGIEVIALTEMNKVIALAPVEINTKHIDPRLLGNMPLDLRVILVWDSDMTDIDLHVTDPNREEASYRNPLTYQGGQMSPDNTTGYGPEEFSLKKAKPGKYSVHVNFYGHRQQAISESTTIQLDFFTGYGTKKQEKQSVTMRLKDKKDNIFVGEFEVK
jgi:Flp pilus assembly protein TadD